MAAMNVSESNQVTPDDIVAYVMKNPENTNPAVLRDLIYTMISGQVSSESELDNPPPFDSN